MRFLKVLPALVLVLGLWSGASADDPQKPSDTIHFSSTAQLITVPVIVTHSGKHVTGLKKEDFVVTQDGEPQTIANFDEVTTQPPALPSAKQSATPNTPKPDAYEFSNIGPSYPTRFTIIAIDLASGTGPRDGSLGRTTLGGTDLTSFTEQKYARDGTIKYLKNNINAHEPIALYARTRTGLRLIHDFSTDPGILVAAIDQVWNSLKKNDVSAPSPAVLEPSSIASGPSGDMLAHEIRLMQAMFKGDSGGLSALDDLAGQSTTLDTLETIRGMARAYTGIPGRKSLVWVSSEIPFPAISTNSLIAQRSAAVILDLNNANMAVYPVDAAGLVAPTVSNADQSPQQRYQSSGRVRGGISANTSALAADAAVSAPMAASVNLPDRMRTRDTDFWWIAGATGGRAILHSNDIAGSLDHAMDDSTQYYQLTYYLKPGTTPGWHKIAVKVNQSHVDVRTRTGVIIDDPSVRRSAASDLAQAIGTPAELTAVPVVVMWSGQGGNSGEPKRVGFQVSIPARGVMIDDSDGNHMNLSLIAVARNAQGKVAGEVTRTIENRLKPEDVQKFAKGGLNFNSAFNIEPGRYSVKFLVRDNISGRVGTVTAPLQVN